MKTLRNTSLLIIALFLLSCATSKKFPVSSIAPAADISASKKKYNHNNYVVAITAKNLASVDRVAPSKSTYVVWILTDNEGIKNLGQLSIRNARTSKLKSLTPFDFSEIFITAEEQGNVTYPQGLEITRVNIK